MSFIHVPLFVSRQESGLQACRVLIRAERFEESLLGQLFIMKPGTWFTTDTIKIAISLVLLTNVLSIAYFFTSESSAENRVLEPPEILSRSERFVPSSTEDRVIHIVKEKSFDWHEHEFHIGFEECPHFRNCRVQTHYITNQSVPLSVPHKGDAVVFTVQAASLQKDPSWWTRAADMRSKDLAWVLFSMRNPFEFPLNFMTFRNYGFNFTMTYKPNSDIFTPYNFWLSEGNSSPRMARKNFAQGKTRKVLWLIDGPCHSINNRMKYAKDLSQKIALDIIGHCYDQSGKVHQVDYSTHHNEGRRGVMSDYKFVLAFEEISCRDYVTTTYFDVAQKQSIIPIGKQTIPGN